MDNGIIKAETWIAVKHPSVEAWLARYKGIFSRNYSGDWRSCNPESFTVELSRDGLYEVLPNLLFFTGTELLGKDDADFQWTEKVLKQRRERIKDVMLPLDSRYFNDSLALEKTLNNVLDKKTALLLQSYTGIDFTKETNSYICKMAPMLLQAAHLRGDYRFLCRLMTCILGFKTDYVVRTDRVRFIVNRPDLNRAAFLAYLEELRPFFQFVEEWFVPFEMQCEYKVRDYTRDDRFEGNNKLMLDYNATLGNKPRKHPTIP